MQRGTNTSASTRRTPVSGAAACLTGLALAAAAASAAMSPPAAQARATPDAQSARSAAVSVPAPRSAGAHHRPERFAGRAGTYYRLLWGVDSLQVRWGESGEVIRFSYRVLDADKAKVLNDRKNEASLIDPHAGVRLVVPFMENVGLLRQTAAPEDGKSYWVVFSNKGRLVKRGDHVNVLIGSFHANGLVVD